MACLRCRTGRAQPSLPTPASLQSHAHERAQRKERSEAPAGEENDSHHGETDYWRVLRAASELAMMGALRAASGKVLDFPRLCCGTHVCCVALEVAGRNWARSVEGRA